MLIVQDGHQTYNRATDAVGARFASGVVWSPGDHSPERLAERIRDAQFAGATQAIDPQLYVARLADANPKQLASHELFPVPMRPRDLAARRLAELVDQVLAAQARFDELTHLIAPTVAISTMGDRNAQSAIDLADASIAWWDDNEDEVRPLLASFAIEQSLLADEDSVDGLLDEITGLDTHGFYLLFELPPDADRSRSAPLIQRALYIVNSLAENDFEIWVGYTGIGGYAMRAAGADVVASGWFQKQQWWSPGHWTRSAGGRAPRPRAFLSTVAGSLLLGSELEPLRRVDADLFGQLVDAAGPIALDLQNGRSATDVYDRAECSMQLFATLAELERRLTGNIASDLRRVHDDLADAIDRLDRVDQLVPLEPRSGTRQVGAWLDAVAGLAEDLGLTL